MIALKEIKNSLLHLFFPHVCEGCGSDILSQENILCMRCVHELPLTKFENFPGNPVEKTFWGRLPFIAATAHFYFTRDSLVQKLMHQFKYRGNQEIGRQLGKWMGEKLIQSQRFNVDALVPLPLFPKKEKRRGYNQAELICEGISAVTGLPILNKAITRPEFTETQTKKSRIERWANIEGKFFMPEPGLVRGKHILLIDDVITTGATLEACGQELLKGENTKLSMAALCFASH